MIAAPAERLGRVRERLDALSLDALLVAAPLNVRWLSGYTGSNALLLVEPGRARLFTDFRYATAVDALAGTWEIEMLDQNLVGALSGRLGELVPGRLGFESHVVSHASWDRLRAGADLVPTTMVVEELRAVKDADEIDRLRRASAASDRIYAAIAEEGLVGRTENEVGRRIEELARELGDGPSFPPIVATADNGAKPHAERRDVAIEAGTFVVIDLGVLVEDYYGDCTRTFATGPVEAELREVYDVVARAQTAALALVTPGTPCIEVHETARRIIGEAGYGDYFQHGTGHGVGLDIHEEPRFRGGFGGVLEPGNAVTVEPGIYLPGRFGVRIEDLVAVTDDGCEVLTHHPKSLIEVG